MLYIYQYPKGRVQKSGNSTFGSGPSPRSGKNIYTLDRVIKYVGQKFGYSQL